jgi:hypothetical protein
MIGLPIDVLFLSSCQSIDNIVFLDLKLTCVPSKDEAEVLELALIVTDGELKV